jgi:hypothetical protein
MSLNVSEFIWRRLSKWGLKRLYDYPGDGVGGLDVALERAKDLNEAGIRTRDGGCCGVDAVHRVLTRTTYIGRHRFNTKFWKTRERKPEAEVVEMAAPPIIDVAEFEAVQALLKTRAAGCPEDIRWAILGHEEQTVAAGYGEGFPVPLLKQWIDKIGF